MTHTVTVTPEAAVFLRDALVATNTAQREAGLIFSALTKGRIPDGGTLVSVDAAVGTLVVNIPD